MAETKKILIKQNYGQIEFMFGAYMDEKGINRNQLATSAGFRFEVADRFYKGNIEKLDVDVLARVCFVLGCEVGEVIKYQKPENKK